MVTPAAGALSASLTRDTNLLAPIEGSVIALDRVIPVLESGSKVILTGKFLRVRVATTSLTLTSADGLQTRSISSGDSLILTARPTLLPGNLAEWTLRTDEGFEGTVTRNRSHLVLAPRSRATTRAANWLQFVNAPVTQACSHWRVRSRSSTIARR